MHHILILMLTYLEKIYIRGWLSYIAVFTRHNQMNQQTARVICAKDKFPEVAQRSSCWKMLTLAEWNTNYQLSLDDHRFLMLESIVVALHETQELSCLIFLLQNSDQWIILSIHWKRNLLHFSPFLFAQQAIYICMIIVALQSNTGNKMWTDVFQFNFFFFPFYVALFHLEKILLITTNPHPPPAISKYKL